MAILDLVFSEEDLEKLEEVSSTEQDNPPSAEESEEVPDLGDEELEIPDSEA